MTGLRIKSAFVIALTLATSIACADTLQLKNGSVIKGKFRGGTETEISFQVGSTLQKYNLADIVSLKFDSESTTPGATLGTIPDTTPAAPPPSSSSSLPDDPGTGAHAEPTPASATVPAGTTISVRTIDAIDSAYNVPGDRFQASLEEPLTVDGNVVAAKDTLVYGRLTQSKESGTFTGRSQLRLELTGIVVNGKTVPVVTGGYQVIGKSRGASTAKRSIAGAALGSIIGAAAGGGKGAAIGAGAGAGAGAASETITKGDQVKVPSETVIDFTLQQDVSIPPSQS